MAGRPSWSQGACASDHFGIGVKVADFTARKQAMHDTMAGALVVRRPSGYVRT